MKISRNTKKYWDSLPGESHEEKLANHRLKMYKFWGNAQLTTQTAAIPFLFTDYWPVGIYAAIISVCCAIKEASFEKINI